jgi:hypothetical protein
MPGGPDAAEQRIEMVGVVDWDESDCERLQKRFYWGDRPSTLDVRLAQEDLWVYEALLRIIKDTNEGTSYENASIKRIEALEIGKEAAQSWKKAEDSIFHEMGGGGPSRPGMNPGAMAMKPIMKQGGPGGGRGRGDMLGGEKASPLSERYVDDNGKSLADESKHPYAEFKMMPINLRLVIHQKKIAKLLANCANSNMPVQVRAVRVRPGEGDVVNAAAAGGPPGKAGRQRGEGAGGGGRAAAMQSDEPIGSLYLPIEVQGIIYIYNPPDLRKLGTGSTTVAASGAAPAAAPPAGPPTGAPPAAAPAKGGTP